MSDIFSEVDEALAQDRAMQIWQKYGGLIIGGIVAIIVLTGVLSYYGSYKTSQAKENTGQLVTAMGGDNSLSRLSGFAAENEDRYGAIASLHAARLYSENNDTEKAMALFNELAKNKNVSSSLRNYAAIRAIALKINGLEQGESAENELATLNKIIRDESSPWQFHAGILAAIIYGDITGDLELSLATLTPLTRQNNVVPDTLRQRAQQLYHIYSVEFNQKNRSSVENPNG
mgnify:CR=1 FL=1